MICQCMTADTAQVYSAEVWYHSMDNNSSVLYGSIQLHPAMSFIPFLALLFQEKIEKLEKMQENVPSTIEV